MSPFLVARRRAGFLRQGDAARAAGIAQSVISDLEHGKATNPTWDVLGRLCQLYACRPDDLLPWPQLPGGIRAVAHREESEA